MPSSLITYPAFEEFSRRYANNESQVVWTRLVADLETPASALLKLREKNTPIFLLESVEGGEIRGRYSIIGLLPDVVWRCQGNKAEICAEDRIETRNFSPCQGQPLVSLRALLADSRLEIPRGLPPMAAGLIGYLSYDIVRQMERLPEARADEINIPDACLMRPRVMVIFDMVAGAVFITTPIWKGKERGDAKTAYTAACSRLQMVVDKLEGSVGPEYHFREKSTAPLNFTPRTAKADYCEAVEKTKEHIAAGDIFQGVLSQRFTAPFTLPPFSLYRAVRHLNPSPFLFYLDFVDYALVGASPEILVRLRGDTLTIRPIAGTRKRGATHDEDDALAEELRADPKECAEHLMLLDLGRNDVGRIAQPGSVKVTQRMMVERYSHVMHLVSNVEGKLASGKDAVDALIAGFPAGTVSGAPKIRAMEIINALEPVKRSFYAGAVGYFSAGGDMDTCITLRTGLVKDGKLHLQAGAGIVADSVPENEYHECVNKAKALMRAAEEAIKFTLRTSS